MTNYCYRKFCNNLMRVVCSLAQSKDGAVFKVCANLKQNQLFALMRYLCAELITGTLYYIVLLSLNGIVSERRFWWLWLPTFEGWPSNLDVIQQQWEKCQRSSSSHCSATPPAGESSPARPRRLRRCKYISKRETPHHHLACKWHEMRISLCN